MNKPKLSRSGVSWTDKHNIKFFKFGFHWGRFQIGIDRWYWGFIFSTDCYGLRGIDLYLPYTVQIWILWDTNKYEKEGA